MEAHRTKRCGVVRGIFRAQLIAVGASLAMASDAASQPPSELARAASIVNALPADQRTTLFDEKLVLLSRAEDADAGLEALVIFAKPPERVYRLLSQTERAREYRPDLKSVNTVERNTDGPIDEQRMRILFHDIVYCLQFRLNPEARGITWELASGFHHDLDRADGFWRLHPLPDGRTLGHFGSKVNVGPAIPVFFQELVTRHKLPATIDRTRRWVDSDGKDRP
jgi:hypothetical protein